MDPKNLQPHDVHNEPYLFPHSSLTLLSLSLILNLNHIQDAKSEDTGKIKMKTAT